MTSDMIFYAGLALLTMIPIFVGIVVFSDTKNQNKKHKHKHKTSHRHAH